MIQMAEEVTTFIQKFFFLCFRWSQTAYCSGLLYWPNWCPTSGIWSTSQAELFTPRRLWGPPQRFALCKHMYQYLDLTSFRKLWNVQNCNGHCNVWNWIAFHKWVIRLYHSMFSVFQDRILCSSCCKFIAYMEFVWISIHALFMFIVQIFCMTWFNSMYFCTS
jgi:hypothetical protein